MVSHCCEVVDVVVFDHQATLAVRTPVGLLEINTSDLSVQTGDEVQLIELVVDGGVQWHMGGVVKRKPACIAEPAEYSSFTWGNADYLGGQAA